MPDQRGHEMGNAMCGLVGFISLDGEPKEITRDNLLKMVQKISHRGPDGTGVWIQKEGLAGLGHARLAVIDTSSSGIQPMTNARGDVLAFNGEIYNFPELRSEAIARGRIFKSKTDSEALLATWEIDKENFICRLDGMFAFAIWDERRRQMLLARDRSGIKPLYYTVQEKILFFASEAKALLEFQGKVATDSVGLEEYLTFNAPISSKTMFSGIDRLMPGQVLRASKSGIALSSFWNWPMYPKAKSNQANTSPFRDLVESAVASHIQSDVPIGTFLSGGIDSSLTSALASQKSSERIKSFHGRYTDHVGFDESIFAHEIGVNNDLDLHVAELDKSNSMEHFRSVFYHLDYPIAGPGSLAQYAVSELASRHVKVVLGGQGGDELFGGYARHLVLVLQLAMKSAIHGEDGQVPKGLKLDEIAHKLKSLRGYDGLLGKALSNPLSSSNSELLFSLFSRLEETSPYLSEDFRHYLVHDSPTRRFFDPLPASNSKEALETMIWFERSFLLPSLLHVEDRVTMAHGLESRVPLLANDLLDFASGISIEKLFSESSPKHLLRNTFSDILPTKIRNREDKMGFPVPISEWSKDERKDDFIGLLENLRDRKLEYFEFSAITSLLCGGKRFSRGTWIMIGLEIWMQEFHDKSPSASLN